MVSSTVRDRSASGGLVPRLLVLIRTSWTCIAHSSTRRITLISWAASLSAASISPHLRINPLCQPNFAATRCRWYIRDSLVGQMANQLGRTVVEVGGINFPLLLQFHIIYILMTGDLSRWLQIIKHLASLSAVYWKLPHQSNTRRYPLSLIYSGYYSWQVSVVTEQGIVIFLESTTSKDDTSSYTPQIGGTTPKINPRRSTIKWYGMSLRCGERSHILYYHCWILH